MRQRVCPAVLESFSASTHPCKASVGCLHSLGLKGMPTQGGLALLFPLSLRDRSSLEEFSLPLFHSNSHIIFSCFIYWL